MTPIDRHDHDAVLSRIAELEAANARLARENEALRAPPEQTEAEPPYRGIFGKRTPRDWVIVATVLSLTGLLRFCIGDS